jgi:hypothetical protein
MGEVRQQRQQDAAIGEQAQATHAGVDEGRRRIGLQFTETPPR